jgi:hypothetical protein
MIEASARPLLFAATLAACHRPSACERFAEIEARCGDVSQHERETTLTLARAICEAATSSDAEVAKAGATFARQAECVDQAGYGDCDEYKKCRDAAK